VPELRPWSVVYTSFDPEQERMREAICALGNGRFVTRGAMPWAGRRDVEAGVSYPGTYHAALYDRLVSRVGGHTLEHEDLVNLCNWLPVHVQLGDEPRLALHSCELADFRQELDLLHGLLLRELCVRAPSGRLLRVRERRLVHMALPHLGALELSIEPLDYEGRMRVTSLIDVAVRNQNVDEYRGLDDVHLTDVWTATPSAEIALARVRTRQSRVEVALATRTRLACVDGELREQRSFIAENGPSCESALVLQRGGVIHVEKVVAVFTSRDVASAEPAFQAQRAASHAPAFEQLARGHAAAWRALWRCCELEVHGHPHHTSALRLHLFHLLQTVSPNSADIDMGVPARGWHGENYRGHVFWDELFVFPILNFRLPELTRALLLYRYRRLGEARLAAREAGLRGAMFPWRSASDGRDATERHRLNPKSGRWIPDHSHLQRHINAAVAYNVWEYHEITADDEFLQAHGAELLLEIARFWASLAVLDPPSGRYMIRGVVGPDEFHDAYPGAEKPGIDNNAYTNVMAVWSLARALDVLALLPASRREELCAELALEHAELTHWDELTRRMYVPFLERGVLEQFDGFARLQPFDWDAYRSKYGDIHRLDNLLEAEDDTPNRYQVCKQADVLMLFYLLSLPELSRLLGKLGYDFDRGAFQRNLEFYMQRTSHGSTLSRVVHAWALSRSDPAHSWAFLEQALGTDLEDIQGGTTAEGIHLGAMAGTVDVFQRAYIGLEARDGALWLNPRLPAEVPGLRLRVRHHCQWIDIELCHRTLSLRGQADNTRSTKVRLDGCSYSLEPGQQLELALREPDAGES
jgi:trehalose/maltose hydrolase-like predicted phosphorylase